MTHVDAPFPKKPKRERRSIPLWAETVALLVIALLLAIFIKQFFVQAFYIPSGSMEPGLVPNDRILVEKWSYWMGSPKRGDIIVFSDPNNWLQGEDAQQSSNFVTSTLGAIGLYPLGGHLVKRVIGIAGDHVDCDPKVDGGRMRINGYPIDETAYLPPKPMTALSPAPSGLDMPSTAPCENAFAAIVPAGDLWVMGDNRGDSSDSRAHQGDADGPFVPVKDVVGKVFAVIWPVGHMKVVHRPGLFDKVPAPASSTPSPAPIG
ncbi:MAG: signal peptidase I [Marmoricola sp.]